MSIQDLDQRFPITDKDGKATTYLLQLLRDRGVSQGDLETTVADLSATLDGKADKVRQIIAGLGLSGGGDLSANRTLNLNAVLDDLLDVDTTTTPPTNGQALAWSTALGMWVPTTISGGGGGGGGDLAEGITLVPPSATDFTVVNGGGMAVTLSNLTSGRGVSLKQTNTPGLLLTTAQKTSFVPPAAGTDFYVKALFSCPYAGNSDGFGVTVKDVNGKVLQWGTRNNELGGSIWNNEASVALGYTNLGGSLGSLPAIWFRLSRIGTDFWFEASTDGESWMNTLIDPATNQLNASLASVGIGWWSQNNNKTRVVSCFHFEAA